MGKWTLEPVGDERKIQKEVMFQELEWCEPDKLRFLDLKEIVWTKLEDAYLGRDWGEQSELGKLTLFDYFMGEDVGG